MLHFYTKHFFRKKRKKSSHILMAFYSKYEIFIHFVNLTLHHFPGVGAADPLEAGVGAELEHRPGLPGPRAAPALPPAGCRHEEAPQDDRVHHLLRESRLSLHLQAGQSAGGLCHPLQPPGVRQAGRVQPQGGRGRGEDHPRGEDLSPDPDPCRGRGPRGQPHCARLNNALSPHSINLNLSLARLNNDS